MSTDDAIAKYLLDRTTKYATWPVRMAGTGFDSRPPPPCEQEW